MSTSTMKVATRRFVILTITGLSIATIMLVWWGVAFVRHEQERVNESDCKSHGKGVAYALHTYLEEFDAFPSTVVHQNGFAHSWRVVVSKDLDSQILTNYDFTKAWSDPMNLKLQDQIPSPLQCRSQRSEQHPHATFYVAVTGPNCVLRDDSFPPRNFNTLNPDTIMLVETKRTDIHWMSPVDLKYSELVADPEYAKEVLGGPHPHGGHFITVDGRIGRISNIGIPTLLKRMFVPNKIANDSPVK